MTQLVGLFYLPKAACSTTIRGNYARPRQLPGDPLAKGGAMSRQVTAGHDWVLGRLLDLPARARCFDEE